MLKTVYTEIFHNLTSAYILTICDIYIDYFVTLFCVSKDDDPGRKLSS